MVRRVTKDGTEGAWTLGERGWCSSLCRPVADTAYVTEGGGLYEGGVALAPRAGGGCRAVDVSGDDRGWYAGRMDGTGEGWR
eukprot:9008325-Pyramimonas_sp.AAC.1